MSRALAYEVNLARRWLTPSVAVRFPPLLQLPYPQVVEEHFVAVAARYAELDAGLLHAEILARRAQRFFAFDSRDNIIALAFYEQGVPLARRKICRCGR